MKNTQHIFAAIEVELHVIGAVLCESAIAFDCGRVLKPVDFFLEKHGVIWGAIQKMSLAGLQIDILTLSEYLRGMGRLELAGGTEYLMEISSTVVSPANAVEHAKIVAEAARRREVRDHIAVLSATADDPTSSMDDVVRTAEFTAMAARAAGDPNHGVRLLSPDVWVPRALEAYDRPLYRGLSTGWESFDQLYRVAPGLVNVWTGIPGHGKSEFLDALMVNMADKHGWRIAYLSPENNPQEMHVQKIAEKAVGKQMFGHVRMSKAEYSGAVEAWMTKHFFFFQQGHGGASLDQVLLEADRIRPAINALVIDPWNRLEARRPASVSETEYILECLRNASRFAERTGISLHIVAHPTKLENDFKTGAIKIPGPYNISGSAHWFNAMDNGFTVFRNMTTGKVEVHVQKIRFKNHGEIGMQSFDYDRISGRYKTSGPAMRYSDMLRAQSKSRTSEKDFMP